MGYKSYTSNIHSALCKEHISTRCEIRCAQIRITLAYRKAFLR